MGSTVGWASRKQPVIALSTIEAQYIALTAGCQEAIWVKNLLCDLREPSCIPLVHFNNKGGELLSKNHAFHQRTKHINVKYHFIRQQVKTGELRVDWIPVKTNITDMLTRALTGPNLAENGRAVLGEWWGHHSRICFVLK
jgi:hypothetical protein